MITVLFVIPSVGPRVFELPAIPSVGHTVHVYGSKRKVMHVEWDLQADVTEDQITVFLGEAR